MLLEDEEEDFEGFDLDPRSVRVYIIVCHLKSSLKIGTFKRYIVHVPSTILHWDTCLPSVFDTSSIHVPLARQS